MNRRVVVRPMSPHLQKMIVPYLFLIPAIGLFLIFLVYPLLKGIQISFLKYSINPTIPSAFVGLNKYLQIFQDGTVLTAIRNTLVYTAVTVPGQMVIAMLAALLINTITRGKVFFRTLYYFPVVTSWMIVSLLFLYLFQSPDGFINYFLVNVFHVISQPVAWLSSAGTAMVPIIALGIWKGIGWSMIIYLAALQTIPHELLEAAAIDGASAWSRFWGVTLPLIGPTVVFTLVMLIIGAFNVFISVYLITGGGPMQQTEVMLSYMYQQAFAYINFGYGAALSFVMAIIIVTISILQMKYLRRPQELY